MPDYNLEYELIDKGFINVFGIDEVARGNLIGPVYATAVMLDLELLSTFEKTLKDSKKMSSKRRDEAADFIKSTCMWSVGYATNDEIDNINILNATKLAMRRAVEGIYLKDYLLVDGNMLFKSEFGDTPYKSIVKGDNKSLSIAAASIVAKTTQCDYMKALDKEYPMYGLASNKGYGTAQHKAAIVKFGVTPVHRQSFKGVKEYI